MPHTVTLPTNEEIQALSKEACSDLRQRVRYCEQTRTVKCNICAVCDELVTIENPSRKIATEEFVELLEKCKAEKCHLHEVYTLSRISEYYTVRSCNELAKFVLSPYAFVSQNEDGSEVLVCKDCFDWFSKNERKKDPSPPKAIWNNLLVGEPPVELTTLTPVEMALVSMNRITTHAFVMHANTHDGIFGYHSMFENRAEKTMADIKYLLEAGLEGEILCVLCGPFDEVQFDRTMKYFKIRTEKVLAGFEWLKQNNHFYKDIRIPDESEIVQPHIVRHKSLYVTKLQTTVKQTASHWIFRVARFNDRTNRISTTKSMLPYFFQNPTRK